VEPFRRSAFASLLVSLVAMSGCSFFGKQVAIDATRACIQRDCAGEQGAAHQQCMGECQRRYGK
jgi:hypothetical protein